MKNIYIILTLINIAILFPDRGDLISIQMMSTRNLGNNQIYINNELSETTTDLFSLDPVEYGYWMYKVTYETINERYKIISAIE